MMARNRPRIEPRIHEWLMAKVNALREFAVHGRVNNHPITISMPRHKDLVPIKGKNMRRRILFVILFVIVVISIILMIWKFQPFTYLQQFSPATTSTPSGAIITKDALEIEKLGLEIEKLRNENNWWLSNRSALLSTVAVLLVAGLGFVQWRGDHKREQAKLDEERFQKFIEGLGSERVEARTVSAIMLLTFLRPGYEKFYSQTFLLAVAHLRLRNADPDKPAPLDALSQPLITVFKEAFAKARGNNIENFNPDDLDATGIHLDYAYLSKTDLRKIRMRGASLRKSYFWGSQLQEAYFKHSDMAGSYFVSANLEGADLGDTNLTGAKLSNANLKGAHMRYADLTDADFTGADLTNTRIQNVKSLQGTILHGVVGLSADQLAACVAKGAIVDNVESQRATLPDGNIHV